MSTSTQQSLGIPASPPSAVVIGYAVGDEVHLVIKGVTNDREYNGAGEILSITGNYAKVRYRQPWARPHNCMRETMVDLRTCRKIKRRIRHNRGISPKSAVQI